MNSRGVLLSAILFLMTHFVFAQTEHLISDGGTVTTCSAILYDSGGADGDYGTYEDYTITFCSGSSYGMKIEFLEFQLATYSDYVSIYNGSTTSGTAIISNANSNDLQGDVVISTNSCITVVFHSNGYTQKPGFKAKVSCDIPCQEFDLSFVNVDPYYDDEDSVFIDICGGTEMEFGVTGNYPNTGVNYTQEDALVNFNWVIRTQGDEVYNESGMGLTSGSFTFTEPGGYYIEMFAIDTANCSALMIDPLRVRVSVPPNFNGANILEDSVCLGDVVHLLGSVVPNSWEMEFQNVIADTTFLPDGSGVSYSTTIENNIFPIGSTITSISDIESICANMEHSYMGDLDMKIECPNGQTMQIFNQGGGGTVLGEPVAAGLPVDSESSVITPGIGYDYCWSASSTNGDIHENTNWETIADYVDPVGNESSNVKQLMEGTYEVTGEWEDLIGCPLNGPWTIHITDHLGSDNGYIFSWQLNYDESVIPDNLWEFTHTYNSSESIWGDDNILSTEYANAIAQPTSAGIIPYTYTVTDDFGCSYDTTVTVKVLAPGHPMCCIMPDANAGDDDQVCGNVYTLHTTRDTSVNTLMWTQLSGPGTTDFQGNEESTDPTVTVDVLGTYTYEVKEIYLDEGCSDTDTVQITYHQIPTSEFTTTFIPCFQVPTTVSYEGNATAAATFHWSFLGSNTVSTDIGPHDISYDQTGTFEINLLVEENGCWSDLSSELVLNPPKLEIASFQTIDDPCNASCHGEANLTMAGGTMPYTYSWGPGPVNPDLCAGTYNLTVTDNNACSVAHSYVIAEPLQIVINSATIENVTCFNQDNGSIVIDASGGTGQLKYLWSDGSTNFERYNMPAGMYGLTISDDNGCSISDSFIITQPDMLQTVITPPQSQCEGEATVVALETIGGTQPYQFFWNEGNGFIEYDASIVRQLDTTTNFLAYVRDSNNCETQIVSSLVTISPTMKMTLSTTDNRCFESCDGNAELHIEGGIPPLHYSWAADAAIYNNLCAGMYDITVTDVLGCQVDTSFIINQPEQLTAETYSQEPICFGGDDGFAFVEAHGGTGEYTYLWPDGSINDTIVSGANTFVVSVTDENECRVETEVTITEPTPIEMVLPEDVWICQADTAFLTVSAIGGTPFEGGTYNYYWEVADTIGYHGADPAFTPVETTTYYVYTKDLNNCSSPIDSVTVNVYPALTINNLTLSSDTICAGEKVEINLIPDGGMGGPYTLALGDGQIVGAPFMLSPEETTEYTITLNDQCATPIVADTFNITVMPDPTVNFVSDVVAGCAPLSVAFNNLTEGDDNTYLWNFGDEGFAITKSPTHQFNESGIHTVHLSVTSPFGCVGQHSIEQMIDVYPSPVADYTTDDINLNILDAELQFVSLSDGADSLFWYFGDGDSSCVHNPVHTFDAVGEYEVKLIAQNTLGCTDTIVKFYNVNDEFTFYAPTAFTPNGDGVNDFFIIKGNGIDPNDFTMRIWNRWGEMVFETHTYDPSNLTNSAWDGSTISNNNDDSDLLPNGVYSWMCSFKDITGMHHEYNGTITIMR